MSSIESFFWYDLETFGLNPFYDRIAQFAGQRTDVNLNPIEDPVILFCRLSADYLPDPGACLVTGITPQEVKQKGIPESEFIERINNLFSKRGTCVCGFNTLKFDDEFIRNALYRNFLDPYEREWKNNCSRWDIIDLVRATHDFRPQGINWPLPKSNGNPVFKLTELTASNGIEQIGAHDAMVDVNATIAVAKLIKEKQPKLFEHYLNLRNKVVVKNMLNLQGDVMKPLLYTSQNFTNPNGCTAMILPISPKVDQDNSVICFNLAKDPSALISCDAEDIYKTPGLLKVAINRCPFLAPVNALKDKDYHRLGIDKELCLVHYRQIMENSANIIIKLRKNESAPFLQSEDPDFGIYSKFFPDEDKSLFRVIRNTPPEQRINLNLRFSDTRCPEMLWRHICRNYPESLDEDNLKKWKSFAATRLLCPPGDPINDIHFVERKIVEKMNSTEFNVEQKHTLALLKEYVESLKRYVGIRD